MISITKSAAEHLNTINKNNSFVRLRIIAGGCSGFSYQLSFDTQKSENDHLFEKNGIKILVDPKSLLYVAGSEIDYSNDMLNGGIKIVNPNAKSSCGCGSSFST